MKRIKLLYVFFILTLIITLLGTAFLYKIFTGISKKQQIEKEKIIAVKVSMEIGQIHFGNILETLSVITSLPSMSEAFSTDNPQLILDPILQSIVNTMDDTVAFVLNKEGLTIAGTPYNNKGETFVGNNYSFRPYFFNCRKGQSFIYPALGILSKRRGIFFSQGIFNNNKFSGVLVIKVAVDEMERIFKSKEASKLHWLLSSPQGIIFAGSKKEYLYKYIDTPSQEILKIIDNENQFFGKELTQLGTTERDNILTINGILYNYRSIDIEEWGWSLLYFNEINNYKVRIREMVLFLTLTLIIFLILLVLFFLVRLIDRQIKTKLILNEYHFIVEQSPISIQTAGLNGKIEYANSFFEKKSGINSRDVIGQELPVLKKTPENQVFRDEILATVLAGKVWTGEVCSKKTGHEPYWEMMNIYPLMNQNKEFLQKLIVISTDITKNKRFLEESLRLRSRLSGIIDSMPSILIGLKKNLEITFWNREAENFFGMVFPDVFGKNFYEKIPEMKFLTDFLNQGLISDVFSFTENRILVFNEMNLYVDITLYPIGTGKDFVLRIDDVTSRFKMQVQLIQNQKMDAVGQLAGGMAHDFNNILAGIMGAANVLQMGVSKKESQNYLSMIMDASKRAQQLIAKVMSFSRPSFETAVIFDIHSITEETISVLSNTIDKKIIIDTDFVDGISTIKGDPGQIQNVFLNLGINASHAMPKGGNLIFQTVITDLSKEFCQISPFNVRPGPFILVKITDTGTGIPPEILDKIFDPFFTTKKEGKGTGLGLSTVYGIIKESGGAISVYSEVNKGTSFCLYFPIASEENRTEDNERESIIHGEGTILIVDDEQIIRTTTKKILESLGYTVLVAENGKEGIEVFKENKTKINLIILDVIMPVMNGVECLKKIRTEDSVIPVIITSGFSREEELEELKALKVVKFLTKPFHKTVLSKTISEFLNVSNKNEYGEKGKVDR